MVRGSQSYSRVSARGYSASPAPCDIRYRAAADAGRRIWSSIYSFGSGKIGITAARPIYAPYTGVLLGVAGLDFVLTAVEELMASIVRDTPTMIAYLLDEDSNFMIAASASSVSITDDGLQANVLECGVPEIEVPTRTTNLTTGL